MNLPAYEKHSLYLGFLIALVACGDELEKSDADDTIEEPLEDGANDTIAVEANFCDIPAECQDVSECSQLTIEECELTEEGLWGFVHTQSNICDFDIACRSKFGTTEPIPIVGGVIDCNAILHFTNEFSEGLLRNYQTEEDCLLALESFWFQIECVDERDVEAGCPAEEFASVFDDNRVINEWCDENICR